MNSFYGGQQGKNFKISAIFRSAEKDDNIQNTNQSLRGDLDLGWTSPIGIGELVYISYGLPGEITSTSFDVYGYNKALDGELGHAYNGTIWQKIYKEPETGHEIPQDELTGIEILWSSSSNARKDGFGYKLIASTTGTTPTLTVNTTELLPDGRPNVSIDNTNLDFPTLTFELPVMPDFQLINTVDSTGDAQDVKWLPPDGLPTVRIERDWENEDETQRDEDLHFVFSIPKPIEVFELDQTETQIVDNPDVGQFDISLEKNSDWQSTTSTDSGQYYSHFGYNLAFKIPRASRFFYAPLDDINNVVDFDVTNPVPISVLSVPFAQNSHEMHGGDFFIDSETGFLFECVESGSTQTLNFIARFDTPTPNVFSESGYYTYQLNEGTWEYVTPAVTKELTGNQDWTLRFIFPPLPDFSVESSFIGAEEGEGSVVGEVVPEQEGSSYSHEYQFTFTIPRGSRWFAGTGAPTSAATDGRKLGDYWLDGETGLLWKYVQKENEQQELENVWSEFVDPESGNQYSIRGPVGKALNVIGYEEYTSSTAATYNDIATQLSLDYPSATDEQIISVYWPSDTSESAAVYWFTNTTNDGWVGTKVTGSISHLLKNEYYDNGDSDDFGYTVEYINGLLKDELVTEDKDKVGYSARFIEELLSWGEFSAFSPISDPNSIVFSSLQPFRIALLSSASGGLSPVSSNNIKYSINLETYQDYSSWNYQITAGKVNGVYLVSFKGENVDRTRSKFRFKPYAENSDEPLTVYCIGNLSTLLAINPGGTIEQMASVTPLLSDNRFISAPNLDLPNIGPTTYVKFLARTSSGDQLESCGYIDYQTIEDGNVFSFLFADRVMLKTIPQLPCRAEDVSINIYALLSIFDGCNNVRFSNQYSINTPNIYRIPPYLGSMSDQTVQLNSDIDFLCYPDAKIYTNADVIYPPSWSKNNNENQFFIYYPEPTSFVDTEVNPVIGTIENDNFVVSSDYSGIISWKKGDRVYISSGNSAFNSLDKLSIFTWSNNPSDKIAITDIVDESSENNIYYYKDEFNCNVFSFIMPDNKVAIVWHDGSDVATPSYWSWAFS